MGQIHAGDLPLGIPARHIISAVVIGRRTPEVGLRDRLKHLFAGEFIRYKPAVQEREQYLKVSASDADVVCASDHGEVLRTGDGGSGDLIHILAEGYLVSAGCPDSIFS